MANQPTTQEKLRLFLDRLRYIKSECHQAVHPTIIRDRLAELIGALEWLFAGQISNAQPNVVPGVPAGQLEDPSKTRVEFTSGPGAVASAEAAQRAHQQAYYPPQPQYPQAPALPAPVPADVPWASNPQAVGRAPGTPINSGDVHFIPGPPPGVSNGGQSVEYVRDGVPVDVNGNPIGGTQQTAPTFAQPAPQPPPPPVMDASAYRIPGGDYGGGQRVEFSGGPARPAAVPPGAPVSNNPPQLVQTAPTITTEAGHSVAPIPGFAPPPPSAGQVMPPTGGLFPGFGPPAPPPPGAPRNLDEARAKIPIPFATE